MLEVNPFLLLTAPLRPVLIGRFFDIIFALYVGWLKLIDNESKF